METEERVKILSKTVYGVKIFNDEPIVAMEIESLPSMGGGNNDFVTGLIIGSMID